MRDNNHDNNKNKNPKTTDQTAESTSSVDKMNSPTESVASEIDEQSQARALSAEETAVRLAKLEEEIKEAADSLREGQVPPSGENRESDDVGDDEIIDEAAIDEALEREQQYTQSLLAAKRQSIRDDEQQIGELSLEDDSDSAQDKLTCLNCKTVLTGPYCYECGQPDRHFIRFFPRVLWEMINEAFDLDSKVFRTIMPLFFRPGSLTLEYITGRRARYVNPLRLYIITSILFFISISVFTNIENDMGKTNSNQGVKSRTLVSDDASLDVDTAKSKDNGGIIRFDVTSDEEDAELRFKEAQKALEELKQKKAEGSPIPDFAIQQLEDALADGKLDDSELSTLNIDSDDMKVTLDDGTAWHPVTNPIKFNNYFGPENTQELNNYLWELKNKAKVANEDPKEFVEEVFNLIPQLMFVVLPLFALLLKVLYIFKKRYYMEHLIVALHSHSFIFMSGISILVLSFLHEKYGHIDWFESTASLLMFAVGAWIPINLFLQQKRVYAQGKFMTFIKFVFIGISYQILLAITALAAMILGLIAL